MAVVANRIVIEADSIKVSTQSSETESGRVEEVTISGETHQLIPWRRWRITIEELEHADM